MGKDRVFFLNELCLQFRKNLIEQLYLVQTGHPGGSLSCVEIITVLYQEWMNVDPDHPRMPGRDIFIMSKGHGAPALYQNLAYSGYFPVDVLSSLRQAGSILQGHPCAHKTPGVEISTGPLGLGLSAGLGDALAGRLLGDNHYTYVLLGDGEVQEGCIWEAAMAAAKFKANHLVAILDHNGLQLDGTNEQIMPLGDISNKFNAFGWNVLCCDGHNVGEILQSLKEAQTSINRPTIIIARTIKGKGISYMENQSAWHGKPISHQDYVQALRELEEVILG